MSYRIQFIASDGIAALAADTEFVLDATTIGDGDGLLMACEAGGLFRIALAGTSPSATITTLEAASIFVTCDGNTLLIPLHRRTQIVKVTCEAAVTNLGMSLVSLAPETYSVQGL